MKLYFDYSVPYDRMLTVMSMSEYSEGQKERVKEYMFKLEDYWRKDERKILNSIEKTAKLKFKKDAVCYIVENMSDYAISHPFTMKIEKNLERAKIVLMHELIHILFVQNKQSGKLLDYLAERYPEQNMYFKVHLPLFLVQRRVIEKIYGMAYFNKVLRTELKLEEGYIWKTANEIYPKFKNGIINFFKI